MLTHDYTYETCLRGSVAKAWTVGNCFRGRDFDFEMAFVPDRIAGVDGIDCLGTDEKRRLNQIPDLLTQNPEGPGHGIDRSRPP